MSSNIQSIGRPPSKHADRITGEIMHDLARAYSGLMDKVSAIVKESSDGSPKTQLKLKTRIERECDLLFIKLYSGKRGRYEILMFSLVGWDPARVALILDNDRVPARPWLAIQLSYLKSDGGGRRHRHMEAHPYLLISHHALSRGAQRLGLRDQEDMIEVVEAIFFASLKFIIDEEIMTKDAPPLGWRVPFFDNGVVVLRRDEETECLVAVTVLNDDDVLRG